jgi:hypothetical protein
MSLIAESTIPTASPRGAERKSNRLLRLLNTIVEARTRMYLEAVTDPATGRIDPALERQVLRMMAL